MKDGSTNDVGPLLVFGQGLAKGLDSLVLSICGKEVPSPNLPLAWCKERSIGETWEFFGRSRMGLFTPWRGRVRCSRPSTVILKAHL